MKDFCIICNSIFSNDTDGNATVKHCCHSCLEKIYLNKLDLLSFTPSSTFSLPISTTPSSDNVYSIFCYQNLIRDLILRAKAQKDYQALQLLISLTLNELPSIKSFISTRFQTPTSLSILPTPSSLWSRLKGKYDIAYLIAKSLSESLGTSLQKPSFKLGWSLFKRSKTKLKSTKPYLSINQIPTHTSTFQKHTLLIVDDILTTSQTLLKLSSEFKDKNLNLLYFTLATSKTFFKH